MFNEPQIKTNAFLNSKQRQIIIDWIIEIEEETTLMDGNCTKQDIIEQREMLNSLKNPALHREMKCVENPNLNRLVKAAG
jgi:hypothetical protein